MVEAMVQWSTIELCSFILFHDCFHFDCKIIIISKAMLLLMTILIDNHADDNGVECNDDENMSA